MLHPRHKLQYFKDAGWPADWIATAKQLVTDVYENSYQTYSLPSVANAEDNTETIPESNRASGNVFDNLPCLVKPKPKVSHDELDAYLAADVDDVTDALEWWIQNRTTMPRLSRMAIDYLSIPGKQSMCGCSIIETLW